MSIRALRSATILALALLTASVGHAHEGPPFEILSNERIGPYTVSVWSDPDIGTAAFFVVLEQRDGGSYVPPDSVRVFVKPVSGRLAEAGYRADPQDVRYGGRYYTEAYLDRGEMWRIRIQVVQGDLVGEVATEVEATPDGTIGPVGLIVYLLPFLAVGFLWVKAHLRRRRQMQSERAHGPEASGR